MTLVVDASTALKWVLDEEGADRARSLLQGTELLIAPDFLALECANVLAVLIRRNLVTAPKAKLSLEALAAAPVVYTPSNAHTNAAYSLAVELGQSAYDCLYLALALAEHATLVTADRRFAEAVQREPAYASAIRVL